jgi:hypothetical protein
VGKGRQHHDMQLRILSIAPEAVRFVVHTDASLANIPRERGEIAPTVPLHTPDELRSTEERQRVAELLKKQRLSTQGGQILAATTDELGQGKMAPYSILCWRSSKLRRVVASTLGAESLSLSDGLGMLEWFQGMWCEALYRSFDLNRRASWFRAIPSVACIDAKSIYDFCLAGSAPASMSDRRVAIDLLIVKQSLARTSTRLRWAPGDYQMADSLTKDDGDKIDVLRAVLRRAEYQLSPEGDMMNRRKEEREARKNLGMARAKANTGSALGL